MKSPVSRMSVSLLRAAGTSARPLLCVWHGWVLARPASNRPAGGSSPPVGFLESGVGWMRRLRQRKSNGLSMLFRREAVVPLAGRSRLWRKVRGAASSTASAKPAEYITRQLEPGSEGEQRVCYGSDGREIGPPAGSGGSDSGQHAAKAGIRVKRGPERP